MASRSPLVIGTAIAATLPLLMGMGQPALPIAEGHLAYRLGQYEKAHEKFVEAGAEDPEARLWAGNAAFRLGKSEEAIAVWQQAAADADTADEAKDALSGAKEQLKALSGLLDRYGTLKAGAPAAAQWRDLAGQFDKLAREAGESLVGRRAALMAADSLAQAGDTAEAVRRFEAAKDDHPQAAAWVLWRMAQLDPGRARQRLTELIDKHPQSPLYNEARVALAEKEPDAARRRQILAGVVQDGQGLPAAERALYLLGKEPGSQQTGYMVRYWNAYPEGRYLDEVVGALAGKPGLSADTHYRIGSYYYFVSEYGKAIRHFDKVRSPMALYRMGRAYWGTSDLNRAVATLKQVAAKDRSLAGKAWLTIGQVEGQRARWGAAAEAYNKAASFGGEAGVTARWKLSRVYREQGKVAAAASLERSITQQFPWSEEATTILWQNFWKAKQAGRSREAITHGTQLAKHHPNHPSGQAAQYWVGRLHERLGEFDKARAIYQGLVGRAPSSYYGWRAHWRHQALTGRGQDPWFATRPGRAVEEPPVRWHDLLGPQERGLLAGTAGTALPKEMLDWPESVRELLFLRQFEVASWFAAESKTPNLKSWMMYLQQNYRQSIRYEKGEPRLNYPLGFAPLLVGAANRHGVDPLLLAALVREESRYDPNIKSWVGATGLAQLMPTTADWVFKNVPDYAGRPLTDPATNLQLGAWYLAYTHRVFDGGSMYAVAAYNGGPGAVGKWKRGFGGDPDEFVETIPYSETQNYVKKVFSSYWNYVRLYGGK
jgi:soluble lytic murein transglycosylase